MATKAPLPPFVSGSRPILGHTVEFLRNPESLFDRGLAEHGPVFSLRLPGRPGIVLIGRQHCDFLFAETDKRLSIRMAYPFFRHMFAPDIYFLAEQAEYRRQREIVLPRFQGRQLDDYVAIMDSNAIALCDRLGDQGEMNLPETFGPVALGNATDCLLGVGVAARLGDGLAELLCQFGEAQDPILPGWVPVPHMRRGHQAGKRLKAMIQDLLAERRRAPQDPPDFLQFMSEAKFADGSPLSDHVRINLLALLIHAGHQTTTGHMCWALVDLLRHPGEVAKVRAEQRELVYPGRPLEIGQVHRLETLDRALRETERLHPITTGLVRRVTESIDYAGYRIPKRAIVLADPRLSHRQAEVFPEPDRYRPDRFIGNSQAKKALIAFSGGTHRCLGARFAYLEMQITLTRLLERFDLELVDVNVQAEPGQRLKWPQQPCRVRYAKKEES